MKHQSWRDHRFMWVIGCIDSHGSITATPSEIGRTHTEEESRGKRWRFCVWSQEFMHIGPVRVDELTDQEVFAVWDWLAKRKYTDDRTMPALV